MMDEATVSALLNRPLNTFETSNFPLYLDIATTRLEQLLGIRLGGDHTSDRTYILTAGTRTLFVDPFYQNQIVTIRSEGDETITACTFKQNDKDSGRWFNTVVFDSERYTDVKVNINADWGFNADGTLPSDLQIVLAHMFEIAAKPKTSSLVKQKQIERYYNVTFDEVLTEYEKVLKEYKATIDYYQRPLNTIAHGTVRPLPYRDNYPYNY